jgi:L-aspartate oxidase
MTGGPLRLACADLASARAIETDLLVLGGGIAGLRVAVESSTHARVALAMKYPLDRSATHSAQGGVAVALAPEDTPRRHEEDTLKTGHGISNPRAVELLTREGPEEIRRLSNWGAHFDQQEGHLSLGREGGHTASRIVHAGGDATGQELVRVLRARLDGAPRVSLLPETFAVDLLCDEQRCYGAILQDARGNRYPAWAKVTVCCTGGAAHLYREATHPGRSTGDGIAMAYRAGAALQDMEFIQFHPTTLYLAGAHRLLVSEAVRGEGAILRNGSGDPFMERYHPDRELAPRDAVSRAILSEMKRTGHAHVYLDLTHLPRSKREDRFPHIARTCAAFGLDLARDWIPVRPAAHYTIGGIRTDLDGASSLAQLFAAGEAACSGVHGANRLASNSLLEGLVFGARAARKIREILPGIPLRKPIGLPGEIPDAPSEAPIDASDVRNALQSLMSRAVGIEREGEELVQALKQIRFWCRYILRQRFDGPAGWELQNLLQLAECACHAAWLRTESRGVHFRTDFPDRDDEHWKCRLVHRLGKQPWKDDSHAALL